ncbi:hypothetical protein OF829_13425 [Sphingomonas sp. LB-2]|uniref:hypothetical protein n=1 Tax=Sphingomonas caeni TaxID=2984949 RepID=UPI00222F258F|nr:hypothetical protein [Sphingomonas caeni]MCW3848241.1 hypothetical protein [Sphingomonas caeni]
MTKIKLMTTAAAMLAGGLLAASPACAQATRTWMSGVGDDANPCSRTAPCKTLQGTISKTAAGGEINCIDPGGFGGVTITKAISIICDDVEAGVLVASTSGIVVNAASTDVVTISGLDIFGPSTVPGTHGINFLNGGVLNVRNTTIKGFATNGITFQPQTTAATMNLDDVILIGNGTVGDATTGTIRVTPAANVTANVMLNNVRASGNVNVGLRLDITGITGARINAQVTNSQFTNSGVGIILKAPAGTGIIDASVTGSVFSGNANSGVVGNGTGATGRFGTSTITGNGSGSAAAVTGVNAVGGATLSSYGTNVLDGNFNNTNTLSNGAFSGTIILH